MSAVYVCAEQETANHIKCCAFTWPGLKATACSAPRSALFYWAKSNSRRNTARRGNTRKNKGNGRKEEKEHKIYLIPLCCHKTIILPVVLYGCETLSLKLKKEHRLRVFESRVLKRIFGPKRGEVTGGWKKLHNEELHNLSSWPSIIRIIKSGRMRLAEHVA
jgi:hypothetical protein